MEQIFTPDVLDFLLKASSGAYIILALGIVYLIIDRILKAIKNEKKLRDSLEK